MTPHSFIAQSTNEVDGRGKSNGTGYIGRTGPELACSLRIFPVISGNCMCHVAASLVRRHRIESRTAHPQNANSHRTHHLVTGKCQKITIELANVNRKVRDRLRRVDQDLCSSLMRKTADLGRRIDDPEYIRHMRETDQLGALSELELQRSQIQIAVIENIHITKPRAFSLCQQLPWQHIRSVLRHGENDFIIAPDVSFSPGG